ncbi:MAG: type II toxin-antitoxin system RelE/ParE family toxin [Lentisphaeraceae bacterium]|nr:type II toxin-antitoxin system RelE/ParE family toxin [Lentisphaeraceae bacterium]
MRVLLTKPVQKWLNKERDIQEADLLQASAEVQNGYFDANLGGHLYKKRIANSSNKGKSGGSRLLVTYKQNNHFFFLFVFNKNEIGNISIKEAQVLKARAKLFLTLNNANIDKAIKASILFEIGEK